MQDIAFSIASLYVSFSLLISGFYIRVSDMTLSVARGLSWASFNKYSFQALARTELQDRSWPSTTCVRETGALIFSALMQSLEQWRAPSPFPPKGLGIQCLPKASLYYKPVLYLPCLLISKA